MATQVKLPKKESYAWFVIFVDPSPTDQTDPTDHVALIDPNIS